MTLRCSPPLPPLHPSHAGALLDDAENGPSAHNNHQINDDVPRVSFVVYKFAHGEVRLQEWGNRESDNAYVHAQCINRGVAHDHELHRKTPTDQDAVEAITRQHESVVRAAADTKVLSLFATGLVFTAAPADDACSVVKKHYDWTKRSWTSSCSTRSHGKASRTFGGRRMFSHRQGSSLPCNKLSTPSSVLHTHHGPSSLAPEPAWKVLVRWLLLGRPVVNSLEYNCAHFVEARLELFWAEEWPALWAMVRAECDVALVFSATRRSATDQKQSRIRKVATLARSGERGRALAAARNAPPVLATQQVVQEIKILQIGILPLLPKTSVESFLVRSCRSCSYHTPKNATTQRIRPARHAR